MNVKGSFSRMSCTRGPKRFQGRNGWPLPVCICVRLAGVCMKLVATGVAAIRKRDKRI